MAAEDNFSLVPTPPPEAAPVAQPEATPAIPAPSATGKISVISPLGELGEIPADQFHDALDQGYRVASPEELAAQARKEHYGSALEELKTGIEGVGQGLAGPAFTGAETGLLHNAEEQKARAEVNPGIHGTGVAAGLIGPAVVSGGANLAAKAGLEGAGAIANAASKVGEFSQSGLLGKAAEAVGLSGAAKGAGLISQVGADAARGAFEGALFQGGEELSKTFQNNPPASAAAAAWDIGLAGILSGVGGGVIGAGLRAVGANPPPALVSEVDRPAFEAGDFKTTIENNNLLKPKQKESILTGLTKEKAEAPEIRKAAERLGAPVLEGMTSDSKAVQQAEDLLINSPGTYSGGKRAELYNQGYKTAEGAVNSVLDDASGISKADLGNELKSSITQKLSDQYAPTKALYDQIKQVSEQIPVNPFEFPKLEASLTKEIPELRVSPGSDEGRLVSRVLDDLSRVKTVDDLQTVRKTLQPGFAASGNTKRVASIIGDKLDEVAENAIESHAKDLIASESPIGSSIQGLLEQKAAAKAAYKPFISDVKELLSQLGKGNVHGPQDALNFINDLTPEQITQRLFSKKDSEFLKFFEAKFPDQMQQMRQYQKGVLKDAASKAGTFSPKTFFNKVNALEPEIQKSIFNSEELAKLKDAETYLRSFPKNFNPSGTSHAEAARALFASPTGAAIANARDFAMEKFIKLSSKSSDVAQAVELAKATIRGDKSLNKAVKGVFEPSNAALPSNVVDMAGKRKKLDKLVADYQDNPQKMLSINDSNPIPQYSQAFAQTSARAVQYLSSIKPDTTPKAPLDPKITPNSTQTAAYNRALDIAQNPLMAIHRVKDGTLTPQDVQTLKAVHPEAYEVFAQRLSDAMINAVNKGQTIPYRNKQSLSLLLGQPLDSTMTPQAILAAQPRPSAPTTDGAPQGKPPAKSSVEGLGKLSVLAMTPSQTRSARRAESRD